MAVLVLVVVARVTRRPGRGSAPEGGVRGAAGGYCDRRAQGLRPRTGENRTGWEARVCRYFENRQSDRWLRHQGRNGSSKLVVDWRWAAGDGKSRRGESVLVAQASDPSTSMEAVGLVGDKKGLACRDGVGWPRAGFQIEAKCR